MRGSKALELLIYCLWSMFVIRMHARWLALQRFFQMLENIGCKENLTGTFSFLPWLGDVLPSCPCRLLRRLRRRRSRRCRTVQLQVVWKVLQGQNPLQAGSGLSQWPSQDQALPSNTCLCLLLGQLGALPAGRILPLNSGSLQATVPECRIFGSAENRVMLIQNQAELIIQKSHQCIPLAFSSMRLGWCGYRVGNFAIWLERMKVGSTSCILHQIAFDLHRIL